tara:strand:+ start:541 stop:819 length:279 start_codon:yes stop_codon:yes gene_type:complete
MSHFIHKDDIVDINGHHFEEGIIKTFDPEYKKPEGWYRIYFQNRKHYLSNGVNQVGDEFPWINGDRYIKSLPELKILEKQIEMDKETDDTSV